MLKSNFQENTENIGLVMLPLMLQVQKPLYSLASDIRRLQNFPTSFSQESPGSRAARNNFYSEGNMPRW